MVGTGAPMSDTQPGQGRHRRYLPWLLFAFLPGLAVVALAGVAWAYWTAPGTGGGRVDAASTLTGVTVKSAAVTPGSTLVPGGSAEVVVRVANANTFPVTVTSVTQLAGQPVVAANGCGPTGVSFAAQNGAW